MCAFMWKHLGTVFPQFNILHQSWVNLFLISILFDVSNQFITGTKAKKKINANYSLIFLLVSIADALCEKKKLQETLL